MELGRIVKAGQHAKKNPEEAFILFTDPASAGNMDGKVQLGLCYRDGIGTNKNNHKSVELLEESAVSGNHYGCILLGLCYRHAEGVKKDMAEAWSYSDFEQHS